MILLTDLKKKNGSIATRVGEDLYRTFGRIRSIQQRHQASLEIPTF